MSKLRKLDWPFLVLVLVHLVGIAGFWRSGGERSAPEAGGFRLIDVELVRDKIGSGDLVDHEADWYRLLPPDTELRR